MSRINMVDKVCQFCSGGFETLEPRQKFCNRSCAVSFNNSKYKKRKRVRQLADSRKKIEKYIDGSWDGTVASGLSTIVRKYLIELAGYKCESCEFSGVNKTSGRTILTVDHADGNCYNNAKSNLRVLCPNCHAMTPTYGALNKGNGRKARYAPRV